VRVPQFAGGLAVSRALIRASGAGHSAAIHSRSAANVMAFGAAIAALRVVVNAPCSQGAAGFATHLAPSFTIGTGYFGRSSIGENIGPQHLVNWTRIAYNDDSAEPFGDFSALDAEAGRPPLALGREAPMSLGRLQEGATAAPAAAAAGDDIAAMRDEIRRIVLEELRSALKG
jgi:acetaldehyde dehydrogenase / alcohol dehydrogenase